VKRPDVRSATDAALAADRIHSAAIRLLRFVRREDAASGVSAAQLSALSVLAFAGPQTLSALAAAEQVRLPTMSRLVADLERFGLVERNPSADDRRSTVLSATVKGRKVMEEGRERRLARLAERFEALDREDLEALLRAADAIAKATGG
jgi:DNA-binding MarR family transcriptional regulator